MHADVHAYTNCRCRECVYPRIRCIYIQKHRVATAFARAQGSGGLWFVDTVHHKWTRSAKLWIVGDAKRKRSDIEGAATAWVLEVEGTLGVASSGYLSSVARVAYCRILLSGLSGCVNFGTLGLWGCVNFVTLGLSGCVNFVTLGLWGCVNFGTLGLWGCVALWACGAV